MRSSVGAVIVSFHPQVETLRALIERLLQQVATVVVVENTPAEAAEPLTLPASVVVLAQGRNIGIAEGFNVGIDYLLAQGLNYVLLSDQDSVPQPGMVDELYAASECLERSGKRVAAVGPAFVDPRDANLHGFAQLTGRGLRMSVEPDASGYVPTDFLISSGMLISSSVLGDVGRMEGPLFIDQVDLEWCFRASAKGYALYGVAAATMQHTIGDQFFRYWLLSWKKIHAHSPFRIYFQFRNSVALLRRRYVSMACKAFLLRECTIKLYIFIFFVKGKKWPYLQAALKGVLHGVLGRTGAIAG